ncbi:hypothetical protein CEXT_402171 [Caerostris extrusa]|uniref:Uncharacterized protein n=1 Tax=Caerostris extrusa TaxID=172846 RepID=A0AAV4WLJ7_CAEEX|nr:hypothetical protein CEXT_402171 [Caerostris extrusa]
MQRLMMKIFLVLLLIGYSSATLYEALGKASDEVVDSFRDALGQATPLHEVLGIEDNEVVRKLQSDVKEELVKHIKEVFRETLKKIDLALEKGKAINPEAIQKLRDLENSLHELDIEDHELEGFKDQLSDTLRQILEKMGIFDKRSVEYDIWGEPLESMLGDLSFRDFFLKIKQTILEKMDVVSLKQGVAKALKQASQKLCEWLTSKGTEKLNNFFDRVLETEEPEEQSRKRSLTDLYDLLKDYVDDLHIDLKDKYAKFSEWVKHLVETGLNKSKDKIENVRNIARELISKSKTISKDVAVEALEFLQHFKDELGDLYEEAREKVMNKIQGYTD